MSYKDQIVLCLGKVLACVLLQDIATGNCTTIPYPQNTMCSAARSCTPML